MNTAFVLQAVQDTAAAHVQPPLSAAAVEKRVEARAAASQRLRTWGSDRPVLGRRHGGGASVDAHASATLRSVEASVSRSRSGESPLQSDYSVSPEYESASEPRDSIAGRPAVTPQQHGR